MPDHRALVVEDEAWRLAWFTRECAPCDTTDDPSTAIALLGLRSYTSLFLDHDLGREPQVGRDVSQWLCQHPDVLPALNVIVHSLNTVSAQKIEAELKAAGRPVARIPFDALMECHHA